MEPATTTTISGSGGRRRRLPLMPCPANRFDHNPTTITITSTSTIGKRAQSVCASFHRFNMQRKKMVCLYYRRVKRRHTHPGGVHTPLFFCIGCNCRQAASEASDHLRLPSATSLGCIVLGGRVSLLDTRLGSGIDSRQCSDVAFVRDARRRSIIFKSPARNEKFAKNKVKNLDGKLGIPYKK